MAENIELVKVGELQKGNIILHNGGFQEVTELKKEGGIMTIGFSNNNIASYAFYSVLGSIAIKSQFGDKGMAGPDGESGVINPAHYTQGEYEVIDILQDKLTPEQFEGFLIGNVLKYMFRERHKNGTEDVKKATWYMNRLIEVRSEDK